MEEGHPCVLTPHWRGVKGEGRAGKGEGGVSTVQPSVRAGWFGRIWEESRDVVEKKEVTGKGWCREQSVKLERKLFLSHPVWQAQVGATGSTWPSLSWKEGGSSPMQCTPYLALALN